MALRLSSTAAALLLALLAPAGMPDAAWGQAGPADDAFNIQGPDREQRLAEGARREGSLSLYTSMTSKDIAQVAQAFEKKYGVKITFWRGSAQKVLQRTVAEAQAAHNEVDVIQAPALVMEALHQENLLRAVDSPYMKDMIPAALQPHRTWTALRAYVYVQAYNTKLVGKDELPKTFDDLLNPRWKGRLGAEAKAQEWFRMELQEMGEEKGAAFFRQLVATNGVSVRSGNSLLNNLVISGEVPFALSVYSYLPEKAKAGGAPIDFIALKPSIGYTDGIGVAQRAAHPHAAMLFFDFMLDEGTRIMKNQRQLTMHGRDAAALDRFKPVFVDPAKMLADYEKWTVFYQETIAGRAPGWQPPELIKAAK
ncbi:extracellular solute-binding protein [Oxalobacteraceae bacterium CAVE-383]|nr:extracellular solute-binding protein [Oxalobacteraceae bacterium CAVE-383]